MDIGYAWHLIYHSSLEPDPEVAEFARKNHFSVTFITSYEDEVEG